MTRPQTIQIFLPDGSPTSIREAEITSRMVKAILFPRKKIEEVAKRDLVHFTGVYFLFGTTEDDLPKVYIGEGECCYKRIRSHIRLKDFWTHGVVVTTKSNEYTKTDAKFLEHYCLLKAREVGRYETANDTGSTKPSLPEPREFDLLDNFETLKILLGTLGYPVFEPKRARQTEIFYCQGKDASATAELTDEGFLVHRGGICQYALTPSAGPWIQNAREKLIDQEVLVLQDGRYVFQNDQLFNSPTAAAVVVLGRNANGWTVWKNKGGQTLDELKR